MRRSGSVRVKALLCLAVLAAGAGALWYERTPLLTWYYLRGLAKAGEENREDWVDRVVGLDEAAVPGLVDLLNRAEAEACANARAGLVGLVQHWGTADPRSLSLAERLEAVFSKCSTPGQREVLELQAVLALPGHDNAAPAAGIFLAAGRTLTAIAQGSNKDLQARALLLADILLDHQPSAEVLQAIRHLTLQGLRAADATSRARALHLVRARPLNNETNLLHLVLPLLRDPAAQVRREAICAIGLKPDVINSEDLLAWLHDPDKEVRRWCEKALRSPQRHLSELELELGRLITDNRAKERLKAFRYLGRDANLEPGVWIRRLSYDPEDAVRIAAARAAAEHGVIHLADRLREMSRSDRSPTVRQEATYYEATLQPRQ